MSPRAARAGARIICLASILLNLLTAALTWTHGWPILNLIAVPVIVGIAAWFEHRWRQDDLALRGRWQPGANDGPE